MSAGLHGLAIAAGIEVVWQDVEGKEQVVSDESLRAVLGALGFAAGSDAQIRQSHEALHEELSSAAQPLITGPLNRPVVLAGTPGRYKITLESGRTIEGLAPRGKGGIRLPALQEAGYHRVEVNGGVTTLAVAPARGFTLEDAGGGAKLWGLAVQLYALRRKGGGGIGDFSALADFARLAGTHGADAVAISPVHAQFSGDASRYGPYAASSRAALNVLYAPLDMPGTGAELIDWPAEAAARLRVLRDKFEHFMDYAAVSAFRREAGVELERHAVFEALHEKFYGEDPGLRDFRNWPLEYQNPESEAVARFAREHQEQINFHVWLQYLADQGLADAQHAARGTGMKIGLITDLAVGTDPAGSHSWTRQDEVLRGLEIGAPPDLFNRAGQAWGITAFSPRGLRQNGYAAFIGMLRHALRHAGGVRIDHVMGLTRLWVIPHGLSSAEGAYLKMPMDDLMRLVILESHRHKAVILGEDLGVVPAGFRKKLDLAGIAGLRVMWFERKGRHFKPPEQWSRSAAAMTTTHDLPTVAGWWHGNDIAWHEKLGKAGESAEARKADKAEIWSAFRQSGAAAGPKPEQKNAAAMVDAACKHLGKAACTLALLPVEDALGLQEQPNFPGTTDEHPNWRRRLPEESEALFGRHDFSARLAALNIARKS